MHHAEATQEGFLVLAASAWRSIEGQSDAAAGRGPPDTAIMLGAAAPCALLMVGAREQGPPDPLPGGGRLLRASAPP